MIKIRLNVNDIITWDIKANMATEIRLKGSLKSKIKVYFSGLNHYS